MARTTVAMRTETPAPTAMPTMALRDMEGEGELVCVGVMMAGVAEADVVVGASTVRLAVWVMVSVEASGG